MPNGIDEGKLKEIVKTAILEVLTEQRDLVRQASIASAVATGRRGTTAKVILFWVVLLLTAVLLYQVFQLNLPRH
jgi:hypothetical protein